MEKPGHGGLSVGLYIDHWDIVNAFVYDTVLGMLSGQVLVEKFNYTDIILIPNRVTQSTPADFRPIALCNTIYKIMTKTINNRLSKVLPKLISHQQCVVIQGSTTFENALLGLELLHHISKSSSNLIALKLDLSKAIDRVEWNLVLYLLRRMSFPPHLIHIINHCIATSHIAIKFNNTKTPYFKPTRGLWQGDPLSPLLFILCTESFSALIHKVMDENN